MTLPWWAVACWVVACTLITWRFDRTGRHDLARPTLYSMAMLGLAMAARWELRRSVRFWIAITAIAALQVPVILFASRAANRLHSAVVFPIALADLCAMLAILHFVRTEENP